MTPPPARAALIRGDGIGPEISDATLRILDAAGARIEWIEVTVGVRAVARYGRQLPLESLATLRNAGIALKAPLIAERLSGGVVMEGDDEPRRYPSINNALRRELGAFVNLRPLRGFAGISGVHAALDLVIVREVTEDIYIGIERRVDADTAEAVKRVTRGASRRVAEFACEYARRHRRRRITAGHKANVLHLTDGLFLESVRETVARYPELEFDDRMIDAVCYLLVKQPSAFDVLVLPNQYGDLVSDLAAGLVGSLGLAPGANFGPDVAIFEAAHGAAPDIAGQGVANPLGLALSGVLLLEHVGQVEAAARARRAIAEVLAEGRTLTADLGGHATTAELVAAVCARAGSNP